MKRKKSLSIKPQDWHLQKAIVSHEQTIRHLKESNFKADCGFMDQMEEVRMVLAELYSQELKRQHKNRSKD